MAKKTTRSRTATIRTSPDNLAAAEKVAALTGRTVSSLAEYALALFIRQNYPLAYNADAVLVLDLREAPREPAIGGTADAGWMKHRGYTVAGYDVLTVSAGSPKPPAWATDGER